MQKPKKHSKEELFVRTNNRHEYLVNVVLTPLLTSRFINENIAFFFSLKMTSLLLIDMIFYFLVSFESYYKFQYKLIQSTQ